MRSFFTFGSFKQSGKPRQVTILPFLEKTKFFLRIHANLLKNFRPPWYWQWTRQCTITELICGSQRHKWKHLETVYSETEHKADRCCFLICGNCKHYSNVFFSNKLSLHNKANITKKTQRCKQYRRGKPTHMTIARNAEIKSLDSIWG
jgi:hypothetical protein